MAGTEGERPAPRVASTVEVLVADRISFDGADGPWHRVIRRTPSSIFTIEDGVPGAPVIETARSSATEVLLEIGNLAPICTVDGCLDEVTPLSRARQLCWNHLEARNEEQERIREVVIAEREAAWERAHALETRIIEAGPR